MRTWPDLTTFTRPIRSRTNWRSSRNFRSRTFQYLGSDLVDFCNVICDTGSSGIPRLPSSLARRAIPINYLASDSLINKDELGCEMWICFTKTEHFVRWDAWTGTYRLVAPTRTLAIEQLRPCLVADLGFPAESKQTQTPRISDSCRTFRSAGSFQSQRIRCNPTRAILPTVRPLYRPASNIKRSWSVVA